MKIHFKKKLLPVLIASSISLACCVTPFLSKGSVVYADEAVPKWSYKDCESVTAFIKDNINTFVEEYNATVEENEHLYATGIEYSEIIYLVEDKNYGTYIDFDGDNGYIVATGNYEIYDMQVSGDLEYLRHTEKDILFSRVDGFLYSDSDGRLLKFQGSAEQNDGDGDKTKEYKPVKAADSTIYPGQYNPGDGRIELESIDEYVAARYPEYSRKIMVQYLSSDFLCTEQESTSYYVKTILSGGSGHFYEGNCALTAAYSILKSWQSNGYVKNLPYSTVNLTNSIKNDILYPQYGTGNLIVEGSLKYSWSTNYDHYLQAIPQLYTELRDYAVKTFGYTPESGLTPMNALSTMRHVCIEHGNSTYMNYTSSMTAVLNYLEERKACLLTFNNSSTYGDHAVALIGYRMYERVTGWWIFKKYKQIYMYEIADGWGTKIKFFDPNTGEAKNLVAAYLEKY